MFQLIERNFNNLMWVWNSVDIDLLIHFKNISLLHNNVLVSFYSIIIIDCVTILELVSRSRHAVAYKKKLNQPHWAQLCQFFMLLAAMEFEP